jgi:hypothetical protein
MPWDNNLYACLGDIIQDTATTVCFPPLAFNIVPNILTYTDEYISNSLPNGNGPEVFPAQATVDNQL